MICVPIHDGEISSTLSKCTCLNTKRHITKDHSQHLRAFKMTSNSQNSPTATISQPPTVMAPDERRGHHKITVASLCCDADEADSAFTAWTKDHQFCGLKASSTSHANPTRANHHQFERPASASASAPACSLSICQRLRTRDPAFSIQLLQHHGNPWCRV
jgi:hypothetical protein